MLKIPICFMTSIAASGAVVANIAAKIRQRRIAEDADLTLLISGKRYAARESKSIPHTNVPITNFPTSKIVL